MAAETTSDTGSQNSHDNSSEIGLFLIVEHFPKDGRAPEKYKVIDHSDETEKIINIWVNDFPELEIAKTYSIPISGHDPKWGLQLRKKEFDEFKDVIQQVQMDAGEQQTQQSPEQVTADEKEKQTTEVHPVETTNDGTVPSLEKKTTQPVEYTGEIDTSYQQPNTTLPQDFGSLMSKMPPIEEAREYFEYIQQVKTSVLDKKKDLTKIGDKWHVNRSGWEKFSSMGFSYRILPITPMEAKITMQRYIVYGKRFIKNPHTGKTEKEKIIDEMREGWEYTVFVEVTTPTGVRVEGTAICEQYEDGTNLTRKHDVYTKAETRAFNRAMSKATGLGEVSTEEIN